MGLNTGKILGISITKSSKKEILEYIEKYLASQRKKPLVIVTPNAEQLVMAQENPRFAKILNQADIAIPDGFPVARLLSIERIAGVEFMENLAALAAKRHVPIRLIGGRGGVAVEAFECLRKKYPGLETSKNAQIIFVGLGAPKQEYFIEEFSKHSELSTKHPLILMAVGGSFDILSGRIPRAPVFMRLIGFEWAWRLFLEPWRLKRQLALLKFLWLVYNRKQ